MSVEKELNHLSVVLESNYCLERPTVALSLVWRGGSHSYASHWPAGLFIPFSLLTAIVGLQPEPITVNSKSSRMEGGGTGAGM